MIRLMSSDHQTYHWTGPASVSGPYPKSPVLIDEKKQGNVDA